MVSSLSVPPAPIPPGRYSSTRSRSFAFVSDSSCPVFGHSSPRSGFRALVLFSLCHGFLMTDCFMEGSASPGKQRRAKEAKKSHLVLARQEAHHVRRPHHMGEPRCKANTTPRYLSHGRTPSHLDIHFEQPSRLGIHFEHIPASGKPLPQHLDSEKAGPNADQGGIQHFPGGGGGGVQLFKKIFSSEGPPRTPPNNGYITAVGKLLPPPNMRTTKKDLEDFGVAMGSGKPLFEHFTS